MSDENYVNPEDCPLCKKPNDCGNLSGSNKPCWCMDEKLTFPESLLQQVTDAAKNKACICKACALKHAKEFF